MNFAVIGSAPGLEDVYVKVCYFYAYTRTEILMVFSTIKHTLIHTHLVPINSPHTR